ncbi:GntR family transcriptional regulator [Jonesia quinghaiensis]|uniref:GntR family transcriptional regulator n=1 Tax=Jonesia quinghaiensis TaxID=262806 RepID=UPI00041A5249|nr:GntR family transcriptional regulator [Jonesia quinghaiensis]
MDTPTPADAQHGSTAVTTLKKPAAVSRRQQVYHQLRSDLMSGVFSPYTRLTEERVAQRYEVSRTPVREALARLLADGLIEKRDGSLFMHMPSFAELTNLYELRITLEQQGIVRAISDPTIHHDRARLETELSRWVDLDASGREPSASFVAEDELFHRTLLDAAGNPSITATLDQVNARIRAVRMYDYLTEDRLDATISEHMGILDLVLSGKLPAALEALREHVGVSKDVVMERAARALAMAQLTAQQEGSH